MAKTNPNNSETNLVKGSTVAKGPEYPGKSELNLLRWAIGAIILVLFTVFGGMITTAIAQYQSSYTDLRDQVKLQNDKIDRLNQNLERVLK